jgi:phage terminase Nu1 subunit (DNA packaging protein)
MTNKTTFTQAQIAWLLWTTPKTIRSWESLPLNPLPALPMRPGSKTREYCPRQVVSWDRERQLAAMIQNGEAIDPRAARARLDSLRADQIEFELAIKRGDYAPIEALRYAVGDMASQIKAIFEGIPKRIKNSLPTLRAREIKILERELVKAGNAVSEIQIDFDIEDESRGTTSRP